MQDDEASAKLPPWGASILPVHIPLLLRQQEADGHLEPVSPGLFGVLRAFLDDTDDLVARVRALRPQQAVHALRVAHVPLSFLGADVEVHTTEPPLDAGGVVENRAVREPE